MLQHQYHKELSAAALMHLFNSIITRGCLQLPSCTCSTLSSLGAVCNCLHAPVLLCSAGTPIPWLSLSKQDILLPANGSETINLTYSAGDMAAGTYRAQLCLFSDFSYGRQFSVVCSVHLNFDCVQKIMLRLQQSSCSFRLASTNIVIVTSSSSLPSVYYHGYRCYYY